MSQFVDILWDLEKVPNLIGSEFTNQIDSSWLTTRAKQSAGKQASGIVRGTKSKQNKRMYIIQKLQKEGKIEESEKLQTIYDQIKTSKPNIDKVCPELSNRFIKIDLENKSSFDGWVTLTSLGNKLKIRIPFKRHKQFNEMLFKGSIKTGVRISNTDMTFMFVIPDVPKKAIGKTLGIDIGQKTILSCSNGQVINGDIHGHTYQSICNKMARKTKGSKAFKRTQDHRTNYINWSVNQLDLSAIKQVNREDIKNLRKFKRTKRSLGHWNYAELFTKLDSRLLEEGVLLQKLDPTYTSQRCSCCGWVRKGNRNGKLFKCDKCGFTCDADLNASTNISLDLSPLGVGSRLKRTNINGFYWSSKGQAPIVPVAIKTN